MRWCVAALLCFHRVGMEFRGARASTVVALENIDLALARGEFLSVLGPSGCGKSTLLRLAAGLELPTSGEVTYDGVPIEGPSRRRGFVFQSYSVFPWLTVRENIAFGLSHDKSSAKDERITKWLQFTGLTDFAEAYPKTLSGGMRQRLALARTMIVEPELLLLDEPFGALDERTREGMQHLLLNAVRDTGCAVIFVTHDIGEAIFLADRLILLSSRPGRILSTYEVTAKKPRSREFLRSEEFAHLHAALLDQFPEG
jgi:ABC-type nitrate/sulfonate/bicarbonate transport system ATPase subunit